MKKSDNGRTDSADWADSNGFFFDFLLEIRALETPKIRSNLPNPPIRSPIVSLFSKAEIAEFNGLVR